MDLVEQQIRELATEYTEKLKFKVDARKEEMESDDKSHYLIYQVLGVTGEEGGLIDFYQNKGRFLYNDAGRFLETATTLCFQCKFPDAKSKVKIPNTSISHE